uniref:WRKY19-like zinc finger domain-containing protein n=1 Tax=Timema poppense TaxID=170557 RepID=A0A7R9DPD8_TIMPO|nr:unnamed protein product [Timema poppensis]
MKAEAKRNEPETDACKTCFLDAPPVFFAFSLGRYDSRCGRHHWIAIYFTCGNSIEEHLDRVMSEIDIPIKSEENFKEEFHDYQEPKCSPGPITFLPIKEELPKHPENLTLSSLTGQCRTSQTINKGLVSDSTTNKKNGATQEDNFYKQAEGRSKRLKHGITSVKRECEEEACSKWARKGGKHWKDCGKYVINRCEEEGCSKQVVRAGKCWKHGGNFGVKICDEEGCSKLSQKGGKCIKHGG